MSTPTETYPLPGSIPTVRVTGQYRGPDGRGLQGSVTFTGPSLITFADSDLFIAGSVVASLDEFGKFEVVLPATDAPGMNPTGWAYGVKENLIGVTGSRSYLMLLPAATPGGVIDLADVAPADPTTPNYVPVIGPPGPPGRDGVDGVVQSVNGISAADIFLSAADVGAIPAALRGAVNGVASLGDDGLVPLEQLPSIPSTDTGFLNVRNFGAVGDGSTNDAPAIQAALNAARDAGGGWVIVPAGTYRLATLPLRIYRNTRLTLSPAARFVRATGATMLLNGDSGQNFPGFTGHGNIVIEGGIWDMQATATGLTDSRMCISIGHAERVLIRDLEVRDVPGFHAIEFNSTKGGTVDNCSFRGYTDPGGRSLTEAIQIDLAAGSGYFGGFGPYDFTPCEDIVIRGCYFGGSSTPGTLAWARGIGSHSSIIGRWHKRIFVANCTFEGTLDAAVRTYAWEDVTVANSVFVGCYMGIQSRTVDTSRTADTVDTNGNQTNASQHQWGLTITGNLFRDIGSGDGAIVVQGEATGKCIQTTITGNTIRGVAGGKSGIRIQHAYRYTITGNAIHGATGTGISQDTTDGGLVANNRVHDSGLSGISAGSCVENVVTNNHVTVCGLHGVHVAGGSNLRVAGNYVKAAGRTDGTGNGYRVTSGASRVSIIGNTYTMNGSGNEASHALNITAGNSGVRRYGNDWLNQGTVSDLSTSPNLSPYDTGA